jgi:RHS repeat-associated protein
VVAVEAIVNGSTIDVSWDATTDAGSGVDWYDLDISVDGDPWQSLLTNSQSTDYQYTAQPGHRYTFRVTATDNVGNVGQGEAEARIAAITKYYYFGGQRVATRGPDGAVSWLHADHLSSTSLATDGSGGEAARQLYYPFGGTRWASVAPLPTDFGFTGQRKQSTIGLYDYHARFYDPLVGRFISADTIVPSPEDPQDFNRYSYVRNNPLKYVDPTGHRECGPACLDDATDWRLDPCIGSACFSGWGSEWKRGWTARDTKVVVWTAVSLVTVAASPEIIGAAPEAISAAGEAVDAAGWKATAWVLRHSRLARLLGWGGTAAAADGNPTDEISAGLQGAEQLLEGGIGGGGGSGQFGPGFTGSEQGIIRSVAERFSRWTGIDTAHLRFWRADSGFFGGKTAMGGAGGNISFFDNFFTRLSESEQLYVFSEEYVHVLQGLTEFGPGTADAAHEEMWIVLELLLSLQQR